MESMMETVGQWVNRKVRVITWLAAAGNGIEVDCVVHDVRSAFGRTDLLVEPLQGRGRTWVSAARVIPIPDRSVCQCSADTEPHAPSIGCESQSVGLKRDFVNHRGE